MFNCRIDGYGFFPQYPYEAEGGTVMVVREDYPYIEEQIKEDDKLAKLMKGKTKEQVITRYNTWFLKWESSVTLVIVSQENSWTDNSR